MLLEQDIIQLKEWGNSNAFRVPQKLLKSLDFDSNQEFVIKAVTTNGHRQLIIEPLVQLDEKLSLVEELSGFLELTEEKSIKEYRSERKEERLGKYESLA